MESDAGDAAEPKDGWLAAVAALFDGIGHPTRIAILTAVRDKRAMSAVAEDRGVSRNTVQDHLNKLIAADLVYRPQESDQHYALTPFGRFFVHFLDQHGEPLHAAVQQVKEAEAEAEAEFADVPLDDTARKKAITNQKWDRIAAETEELLQAEGPEIDTGRCDEASK